MLSNAYFLAKFRFDTAENEPAKNLQNNYICKKPLQNLPIFPPLHKRTLSKWPMVWTVEAIDARRSECDSCATSVGYQILRFFLRDASPGPENLSKLPIEFQGHN